MLAGAAAIAAAHPRTGRALSQRGTTKAGNRSVDLRMLDQYRVPASSPRATLVQLGTRIEDVLPGTNQPTISAPGYVTTISDPPLEAPPDFTGGSQSGASVSINPDSVGNTGTWSDPIQRYDQPNDPSRLTMDTIYQSRIVGAHPVASSAVDVYGKRYVAVTWELEYEVRSARIVNINNGGGTSKFPGQTSDWHRASAAELTYLRGQGVPFPE